MWRLGFSILISAILLLSGDLATAAARTPKVSAIVADWCATETSEPESKCTYGVYASASNPSSAVDSAREARSPLPRIDADTSVVLVVKHFNFITFSLGYEVEEKQIEAYQTLEKLWAQLLGIPFRKPPDEAGGTCQTFIQCLAEWNGNLIVAAEVLREKYDIYRQSGPSLNKKAFAKVQADEVELAKWSPKLVALQDQTLLKITAASLEDQEKYKAVREVHRAVLDGFAAFAEDAKRTLHGETKVIGKRKAGTQVTVTLSVKENSESPQVVEYFVHSSFPVLFHAGYVFAGFRATDFEKVRTAAGSDLFSQILDEDKTTDLTAFLSYECASWGDGRNGVLVGLGTGLRDPGDTLYVVASIRFKKRIYLSGGIGSNVVAQGSDPVASNVAAQLGVRELFTAVTTRRQWKGFVGISFSPF